MLEWMFFVFLILHTESTKLQIMKETQIQDQIQLQKFIQDVKHSPQKLEEFLELRKNKK